MSYILSDFMMYAFGFKTEHWRFKIP